MCLGMSCFLSCLALSVVCPVLPVASTHPVAAVDDSACVNQK